MKYAVNQIHQLKPVSKPVLYILYYFASEHN